jgi:hypothetical protein
MKRKVFSSLYCIAALVENLLHYPWIQTSFNLILVVGSALKKIMWSTMINFRHGSS